MAGPLAVLGFGLNLLGAAKKASAERKQAKNERQGNLIRGNREQAADTQTRRRLQVERRIRRARIESSSAVGGVAGSSGELGAKSALGSSFNQAVGGLQANILATKALTRLNQSSASAVQSANNFNSFANVFNSGVDFLNEVKNGT